MPFRSGLFFHLLSDCFAIGGVQVLPLGGKRKGPLAITPAAPLRLRYFGELVQVFPPIDEAAGGHPLGNWVDTLFG